MFEQSEGLAELTSAIVEGLTFSHPPLRTAKRFRIRRERPPTADAVEERQIHFENLSKCWEIGGGSDLPSAVAEGFAK